MSGATAHDTGGAQAARVLPPMGESVRDVGADDVERQDESPLYCCGKWHLVDALEAEVRASAPSAAYRANLRGR